LQHFRDTQRKEGVGYNAQKNTIQYTERDETKREQFIAEIEALPADSELYYIDESGFDEYYCREYGYAPRGEKVIGKISGRHFARTSVVSAQNGREMIAPFAFDGHMDGDLFEGWLEHLLIPALPNPSKTVLILDNASWHRKDAIYDIADDYGFNIIFLPPYSPDLNPIEKFWAIVKRRLRLFMHLFDSFPDALSHAFQ
jgi:transposase